MPPDKSWPDRVTLYFLAAVALIALIYISFGWTPSSYGFELDNLHVKGEGPLIGTARAVRTDEFYVETPYFQAAVRNHFHRINDTSFYREDLRNYYPLPLADWSLAFKPQMWAFFVLSPAEAFSIYHTFWMCAFLAGYVLLFRDLGSPGWIAVPATLIVFFSGFTQFWWTTYGPLLAGLPWILLAILHPMAAWKRILICIWIFPAFVLSHVYPTLLLDLAWGAFILILAFRPSLFRSPWTLAAVAAGVAAAVIAVFVYYGDIIPIMRNTIYPGRRISPSGDTPVFVALSQIIPSLTFNLDDYQNLLGLNICEIGTLGSLLPLLTLCLLRYRSLRVPSPARRTLLVLLAGFVAITLWELAPIPAWIGSLLFWNTGDTARWLFTSGLLLLVASVVVWNNHLISLHPLRFTLFAFLAPVAAILLKSALLASQVHSNQSGLFDRPDEIILYGLVFLAGLSAWFIPAKVRAPVLLIAVVLVNVYAFGRFNPIQSAGPIFNVPDSDVLRALRKKADAMPGGVLLDSDSLGATLNGLGFRSINHALLAPQLAIFRRYFPDMDPRRFNEVFNRYAFVFPTPALVPDYPQRDVIRLPIEVFVPVRNLRRTVFAGADPGACSKPTVGGVDRVSANGDRLTVEGSAPWMAETDAQGIRVLSARQLKPVSLTTVTRPDIGEKVHDYRFVKAGFKLQISSADAKPLRPEDVVLFAFGTTEGEVRLACCACP